MTTLLSRLAFSFITLLVPGTEATQRSGAGIATEKVFEVAGVREGATVCESGAGDGAMSVAAARVVGTAGRVYTSELGEARVEALRKAVARSGLEHVTVVAGDSAKTNFPAGACDALFMRDVYHHFTNPAAINASILAALKPGARLAIVEFTPPPGNEASVPNDRAKDGMHGICPESLSRELQDAGFVPVASDISDDRWFLIVVAKPAK